LLAAAWVNLAALPLGSFCALAALGVYVAAPRLSVPLDRRAVVAAWGFCAIMVLIDQGVAVAALFAIVPNLPAGIARAWAILWLLGLATVPTVLVAWTWSRWPEARATRIGATACAAGGALLVLAVWNDQLPGKADADAATLKPDLVAMLASRPGPVLWTDGDEAWYWARRDNWNAPVQGSAIVFSRDLATIWHARAEAVVAAGLASSYLLRPLADPAPIAAQPLDSGRIRAFCHGFDAAGDAGPAWIVVALDADTAIPPDLGIRTWSPPLPLWQPVMRSDGMRSRRFDRYAVIPCAAGRSGAAAP
jgi:hypothetical protein